MTYQQKTMLSRMLKLVGDKRTLNAVEVAHLYHAVESNIVEANLIMGFAKVAQNQDVKKYFSRGKDLSKQFVKSFSKIIAESDIPVPALEGERLLHM